MKEEARAMALHDACEVVCGKTQVSAECGTQHNGGALVAFFSSNTGTVKGVPGRSSVTLLGWGLPYSWSCEGLVC